MKTEPKRKLEKGRIYLKQGDWMVRHVIQKKVKGGSPKQLGSYQTKTEIKYYPILPASSKDLKDPYDQGKETCFELVVINEPRNESQEVKSPADTKPVQYAKLWSISKMVRDMQHYFETTPQEQIDAAWEATEKQFDNIGPTMDEFLGIEQEEEQLQMIPKSQMKEGWYNGHCRNAHMAYWDASTQMFFYLRYSFNFYMDKIEHFDDVREGKQDGFIPIERVERINWVDVNRIKQQVGY